MPRAKNDPYKRKAAQALNHTAAAILDLNDIYKAFVENRDKIGAQVESDAARVEGLTFPEGSNPDDNIEIRQALENLKNLKRYEGYCRDLETIMTGINACREHVLIFVNEIWALDEDTIRVYLG